MAIFPDYDVQNEANYKHADHERLDNLLRLCNEFLIDHGVIFVVFIRHMPGCYAS